MMATIKKSGWGPWAKTTVEHGGKTDTFSGEAQISEEAGRICVSDKGFISDKEACYLEETETSSKRSSPIPDGEVVSRGSKQISIETEQGKKSFDGGFFSTNSVSKSGDKVSVVKHGMFGDKVVEEYNANNISKIESENCNICKAIRS